MVLALDLLLTSPVVVVVVVSITLQIKKEKKKKKKEKEKKEKNLGEDVAADKRLVIALECVLSTIEDDCSRMCSLYYRGRLL